MKINELSELLDEAISIYKNNYDLFQSYNDSTVESFSSSYEEELFDDLDSEFYSGDDYLNQVIPYIKENIHCFGD